MRCDCKMLNSNYGCLAIMSLLLHRFLHFSFHSSVFSFCTIFIFIIRLSLRRFSKLCRFYSLIVDSSGMHCAHSSVSLLVCVFISRFGWYCYPRDLLVTLQINYKNAMLFKAVNLLLAYNVLDISLVSNATKCMPKTKFRCS